MVYLMSSMIPKNEFFDYEAKYTPGMAEEITPARISASLTSKVQSLSSEIYDLCSCKGIVRVDYILKDQTFYFLEINTVPGMTATSFIPQQIKAAGLNLTDLLTEIIENNVERWKGVLTKHNTLFHRENQTQIEILRIYDTRQNPQKLKFK